jgi:hypothetical protein
MSFLTSLPFHPLPLWPETVPSVLHAWHCKITEEKRPYYIPLCRLSQVSDIWLGHWMPRSVEKLSKFEVVRPASSHNRAFKLPLFSPFSTTGNRQTFALGLRAECWPINSNLLLFVIGIEFLKHYTSVDPFSEDHRHNLSDWCKWVDKNGSVN